MSILKFVMFLKDNSVGYFFFGFWFCYFECYYFFYFMEEFLKINMISNKYSFWGIIVGEIFYR